MELAYSQDAASLANQWCFLLTRRRLGSPRDLPGDMAYEFQNLIDMGFHHAELLAEVQRQGRDRSEFMWQFRERLKAARFGDPKKPGRPPETAEQLEAKRRRQVEERERAQQEREQAARTWQGRTI